MTRFARKGGVTENKEAKKKKQDATDWSGMFKSQAGHQDSDSQSDDDEKLRELNEQKRKHESDLNKRIEIENSNIPVAKREQPSQDYEATMQKYSNLVDKEVLEDLLEMKRAKTISEADFLERVAKEARSNQRRLNRQTERENSKTCFKCRRAGHSIDDCPEMRRDSEQGVGICYKCGSTEHAINKCKAKVEPGGED